MQEHFFSTPRTARCFTLGSPQGATTVCRWAAFGAARIDRLMIWGGEVPPDLDLGDARVSARLRDLRLTLVYGTKDQFFTLKIVASTESRLKEHKVDYERIPFDGGHEIDEATLRSLI